MTISADHDQPEKLWKMGTFWLKVVGSASRIVLVQQHVMMMVLDV